MKKYVLFSIFSAVTASPLFAENLGGGNTCTPRDITCDNGTVVKSGWCGSDEEAKLHACPIGGGNTCTPRKIQCGDTEILTSACNKTDEQICQERIN